MLLSNDSMNELVSAIGPSSSSSFATSNNDNDDSSTARAVVDSLVSRYQDTLNNQRLSAIIMISLWGAVVLIGLLSIVYDYFHHRNHPLSPSSPSNHNNNLYYNNINQYNYNNQPRQHARFDILSSSSSFSLPSFKNRHIQPHPLEPSEKHEGHQQQNTLLSIYHSVINKLKHISSAFTSSLIFTKDTSKKQASSSNTLFPSSSSYVQFDHDKHR